VTKRWASVVVVLGALGFVPAGAGPLPAGTFDPSVAQGAVADYEAVAVADINGDGNLDVAATSPAVLHVLHGDGDGALVEHARYPTQYSGGGNVAAGDLNGDGLIDLAVAIWDNVELFRQSPSGSFASLGKMYLPEARNVRIGDVTADGRNDLVVTGWAQDAVYIYWQTRKGTLSGPISYPAPFQAGTALQIADIDADGDNDVVAMSVGGAILTLLIRQARGMTASSYQLPADFPTNAGGFGVGDIDGDGRAEIALTHGGNYPRSKVTIFDVEPDGTLTIGTTHTISDIPGSVAVADFDRDGFDDVAIIHGGTTTLTVLYGSTVGLTSTEYLHVASSGGTYYPHALAAADLDSDGDSELALAHPNGVLVFHNRLPVNLSVEVATPTAVRSGALFEQAVTVTNPGDYPMSAAVHIEISADLKIWSWSDPACSVRQQSMTCPLDVLARDAMHTITVRVRATRPSFAETTATLLDFTGPDGVATDNSATAIVTVGS
jgi:hypothetical protein